MSPCISRLLPILFLCYDSGAVYQHSDSFRIVAALFGSDTHKILRNVLPLTPNNSAVKITFQLSLNQILEVDEKNEVLRLNLWLRTRWTNLHLKWNPEKFGGIKTINVETESVWTPDITLWNRAIDQKSLYRRMNKRMRIDYNGTCHWKSLISTTSSCTINVKKFPFDQQNCTLLFGSWHHSYDEVSFELHEDNCVDTSYFSGSREWHLLETYSSIEYRFLAKDGNRYDVIHCTIAFQRYSMFYVVNMVIPCAIIGLLAFLTFYLPPSSGERVSVVITVLLAVTVYMSSVADSMPPASDQVPLIQKFYLATIIETAFCLLGTCIVVNWYESTDPMPEWIYVVFNCILPKLLFVKYTTKDTEDDKGSKVATEEKRRNPNDSNFFAFDQIYLPMANIAGQVSGTKKKQNYQEIPRDWSLAARSLNKLFLILFTSMYIITIAVMFYKQI